MCCILLIIAFYCHGVFATIFLSANFAYNTQTIHCNIILGPFIVYSGVQIYLFNVT